MSLLPLLQAIGERRIAQEDKKRPPPERPREKAVEDERVIAEPLTEKNNGEDYDEAALWKYQLDPTTSCIPTYVP